MDGSSFANLKMVSWFGIGKQRWFTFGRSFLSNLIYFDHVGKASVLDKVGPYSTISL